MPKKVIASYVEQRNMEVLMVENTMPLDTPSHRAWYEGWSFERVAKAVNKDLNGDHARRVAKACDVVIVPTPPPPSLEERIGRLEMKVNDLIIDMVNMAREIHDANSTEEWKANPDYAPGGSSPTSLWDGGLHPSPNGPLQETGGSGDRETGEGGPVPLYGDRKSVV